jgi:hypothetical protein
VKRGIRAISPRKKAVHKWNGVEHIERIVGDGERRAFLCRGLVIELKPPLHHIPNRFLLGIPGHGALLWWPKRRHHLSRDGSLFPLRKLALITNPSSAMTCGVHTIDAEALPLNFSSYISLSPQGNGSDGCLFAMHLRRFY